MGNSLVAFYFVTDSAELIHSPLHEIHVGLGAKFAAFGGWDMPLEYAGSGVVAEHLNTRSNLGIFDVSHLGTAIIKGPNAARSLNDILTNDINRINPGQAQYSMILNEEGKVVDDLIIYLKSSDEVLIIPNAGNATEVLAIIRKNLPTEIEVINLHQEIAIIAIQGPKSLALIKDLNLDSDLDYLSFKDSNFDGYPITICRTGYTGEFGFEVLVGKENVKDFWHKLFAQGEKYGIKPVGLGARDTLRTEMGYPLHGQDISLNISPLEAGLGFAVITSKPKFIGKAAIEAEKKSGVKRKLFGIKAIERAIPRSHMNVFDVNDTEIGEITSGTFSPTLKQGIALALLDIKTQIFDKVFVDVRGKKIAFEVTKPPFVESKVR